MSFYTVYKTTNVTNGKFYIGVHKTDNVNDDYLGSGKVLKRAISKYGIHNFSKEILFIFENAEDAYLKEKELVNEELILSDESYNLRLGGFGGFDWIIKNKLQGNRTGSVVSQETKDKIRAANLGKSHSEEAKNKMRIAQQRPEIKDVCRETGRKNGKSLLGKPKSISHVENIRKSITGLKRISDDVLFAALEANNFDFEKTAKSVGWKSSGGNNHYRMKRVMGDRQAGAMQGFYKAH